MRGGPAPLAAARPGGRVVPPRVEAGTRLGIDLVRRRLLEARNGLGGLPKKKGGKLEKQWGEAAG